MKAFADLAKLPEDDRIRIIGECAMKGNTVGFIVDDQEAKIARYVFKLQTWYPGVKVERLGRGPTRGAFSLRAKGPGVN